MSEKCDGKKFGFHGLVVVVAAAAALAMAVGVATGKPGFMRHHGPWGHGKNMTQEDLADFSEFAVKRFSRHIEATDQQRGALQKQVDAVIPKMMDLHKRKDAVRQKVIAALAQEKVDRAALESARQEAAALANEASGLIMETALAASEILTPEQRKELVAHLEMTHGS
ncbi:MAG: periplasmic heavy metal sensor [Nitrospinota bacterium]|nr:periplasmic heavy metal sensor [Nitrospinota bacterium]MDH5678028.1 periplasmic heavy metal sensor [Nitrospinota bacterium]